MAAAIFLGAGPLLVTEAGVTALLVVDPRSFDCRALARPLSDAPVGCCVVRASSMHLDEAGGLDGAVRGYSERRDDPGALSDVPD